MSTTDDAAVQEPRLAQCTITGKMVPEDELVTINGHRVCAEGKAILLERLKAGEALPGERVKPTAFRRFCCIFLDCLILGIPFAIIGALVNQSGYVVAGIVSLVSVAIQIIYFAQMHAAGGQTLGKKAGKLIVINLDGSPISTQTAYVRALAYCGPSILSSLATMTGSLPAVGVAGVLVGAYGLVNVIMALVDRQMQRASTTESPAPASL